MNYLVTGGRGFIGCHVMRYLRQMGHTVVCYSHNLYQTSMHEVLEPEEYKDIKVVVGQLDDLDLLVKTIRENDIDIIIHEGALLGSDCEADPIAATKVNIVGTTTVFEAARLTGIKRVVWASSQSIFGMPEFYDDLYGKMDLIPNDVVLQPTLVYGGTKTWCEFIGNWYYKKYGLETIGLRYCLVFGVGRQRGAGQFVKELINNPAEGRKGVVENGDTAPCWIYADDAARATYLASICDNPTSENRNYTIGGDIVSMREIREYILTLLPDADIEMLPGKFPAAYNLDLTKAEKDLGFKAEISVYEGVKKTINLLRAKQGLELV